MPALFATFLLLSLALAGATAFSPPKSRRRLKWLLVISLLVAWIALAFALNDIVVRTSTTLVTPGGARQPQLIDRAAHEGLTLLATMAGPALLATVLAWLALRATRPKAG